MNVKRVYAKIGEKALILFRNKYRSRLAEMFVSFSICGWLETFPATLVTKEPIEKKKVDKTKSFTSKADHGAGAYLRFL